MQGQRSTFELDCGSSMKNSGMDQKLYWKTLRKPAETTSQEGASLSTWNSGEGNSKEHPLSQCSYDESKMEKRVISSPTINERGKRRIEERQCGSSMKNSGMGQELFWNALLKPAETTSQEGASLSTWNSGERNSKEHPNSQGSYDEYKMEKRVISSPTINERGKRRIEERQSVENVDLNLNNPINNCYPFLQNSESIDLPQNFDHNLGHVGTSSQCPYPLVSALSKSENSSSSVGLVSEIEGMPGGSLDDLRLPCKRKNIEVPDQISANGSSSAFRSSDLLPGVSPARLNPRIGTIKGGMAFDCCPSGSATGNTESLQRNSRMRINTHSLSTHEPSSLPNPFDQSLEFRPVSVGSSSQSEPQLSINPGLPRNVHLFPWTGDYDSRIGSSSSSPVVAGERLVVLREERNSRSTPRNNYPTTDRRNLVQVQQDLILANGNAITGNEANYGFESLDPVPVLLHQNSPNSQQILRESVLHRLFASSSSAFGGQSIDFTPQQPGHSATSEDVGRQFRVRRLASLIDRQRDGFPAVPMPGQTSATAREWRDRISEGIRMMGHTHRGEDWLYEDGGIFDHLPFVWGPNLLDRHRNMRLDVDNMSYEELLALGERIGDVSTGLSEEMVSKCLKLQIYLPTTLSAEAEPCCVCREEYVDGDKKGVLDCGHDFHPACIKQWLLLKNLCPICKTAALANA